MKIPSVSLNGKRTYAPSSREELIDFFVEEKGILVAMNAEKILNPDPELSGIINSNIAYPDGVGAVKALKKYGLKTKKIPGVELWLDIVKSNPQASYYLVGCTNEVISSTVSKLKTEFEGINVVNFRDGFMDEAQTEELIADIKEKKPDFVFVAMGSPRQEKLMMRMKAVHNTCYMGLGGSFNVYTGTVKRAPVLFQKLGCEWLYRLLLEPTRIKRQLKLVKFFILLSINKL